MVGSTATVVRNSILIISHITFRDCGVHIFPTTFLEIAVYVYVAAYLWVLKYEHTPEKWGLGRIWGLFQVSTKLSP